MDYIRTLSWRLIAIVLVALFVSAAFGLRIPGTENLSEGPVPMEVNLTLASTALVGFISKRIRWIQHIDTFLHEFGHAATVTFFGGVPKSIKLNQDTSGATNFRHTKLTPFREILISAAGPTASVFALLLVALVLKNDLQSTLLSAVGLIVFLVLVSTIRSSFGVMVGILLLMSFAFTYAVSSGLLPELNYPMALDLYLAGFIGLTSGVAVRSALSRIRFHGPHGDEGKIAKQLRLPEVLVDWGLVIVNVAMVIGVVQYLDVSMSVQEALVRYPEAQAKLSELVAWFGQIPLFK